VAFPKLTSKIVTDLNRESSWNKLVESGYESLEQVSLDHVWNATQFKRSELFAEVEMEEEVVVPTMRRTKRLAGRVSS
jgi:hypothetical protein